MSKYIAEEKMGILDLYKVPTMKDVFEILAGLGKGAVWVVYSHEEDTFLAQYKDKSYIMGKNVLGDKSNPDFESGVLSDEGWERMNKLLANERNPLSRLN